MTSQAAAVLDGEGHQNVGASMRGRDGLAGGLVRKEFLILRLFRSVARDRGDLMEDRFPVDGGHDGVGDEMSTVREEVQCDHISRAHITIIVR